MHSTARVARRTRRAPRSRLLRLLAVAGIVAIAVPAAASASWNDTAPTPTPLDYSAFLALEGTVDGGATLLGFHSGVFAGLDAGAEYQVFVQRRSADGAVRWTRHVELDQDCRWEPSAVGSDSHGDHVAFLVDTCDGTHVISVADADVVADRRLAPIAAPDEPRIDTDVLLGYPTADRIDIVGRGELLGAGGTDRLTVHRLDASLSSTGSTPVPVGGDMASDAARSSSYVTTEAGVGWLIAETGAPLPHLDPTRRLVRVTAGIDVVRSVSGGCRFESRRLVAAADEVWMARCDIETFEGGWREAWTIDVLDGDTGDRRVSHRADRTFSSRTITVSADQVVRFWEWGSNGGVASTSEGIVVTNGSADPEQWWFETLESPSCYFGQCPEWVAVSDAAIVDADVVLAGAKRDRFSPDVRSAAHIERRAGPELVPVGPARLLDTRVDQPTVDGRQAGGGRLADGETIVLEAIDRAGIPDDAAAVMINIAAVRPTAPGFVTAYPCDVDRPVTSSLNHGVGGVTGNNVVVPVSDDGTVCVFALRSTDLVIDVSGWFSDVDGFGTIVPARMMETRVGRTTVDGAGEGGGPIRPGVERRVVVAGRAGIPADAVGVIANVTAVGPAGPGFVSLRTCGTDPSTSTLNIGSERVRGNSAFVALDQDGALCVAASVSTDLTIDVTAWIGALSSVSMEFSPRVLDTRESGMTYDGESAGCCRLDDEFGEWSVGLGFRDGFQQARAVVLSVIAVRPTRPGYVTVWACDYNREDQGRPTAATINFGVAQATANTVVVPIDGESGDICLRSSTAVDVVMDVIAVS